MRPYLLLFALAAGAYCGPEDSFVLRGVTVHPITSAVIPSANVVVTDGRIAEVGPKAVGSRGHRVIEAKGMHLYPGMIDSASMVGLSEIGSLRETQDTGELGDFNPQLRSLSAVNPSSEHIPVVRASGITASMIVPSGGFIGGQTALLHLEGRTWEEMVIEKSAAMQMRLPTLETAIQARGIQPLTRRPFPEVRRKYTENMRNVRRFFTDARAYRNRKANPQTGFQPDLRFEAMLPVLEGTKPLLMYAERERAIRDALALAESEKVKVVLAGVREVEPFLQVLAQKQIAVILPDLYSNPLDEDAPLDEPINLPAKLFRAGVKFAFGSHSMERPRDLPFQAANAVAQGLPVEEALRALTIVPAEIWGVADKIGSIAPGKYADLILTDGDPLETRTQILRMWIMGKPVSLESRHTRLYERYSRTGTSSPPQLPH